MTRPGNDLEDILRFLRSGAPDKSSDFDLNPEITASWPADRVLRPAAVLVPLIEGAKGLDVVLTKRASHLKHHPGQIAFPGGKVDDGDADAADAALREASEEIGLDRSNVQVLGILPFHQTVTSFIVTPVVGLIERPFTAVPEAGEVAEVFRVPLDYLSKPENFIVESRFWQGTRRYYYTIPYGPYYIWGATARMLKNLADGLSR